MWHLINLADIYHDLKNIHVSIKRDTFKIKEPTPTINKKKKKTKKKKKIKKIFFVKNFNS